MKRHRFRTTGGRWWNPRVTCPDWCASDHQCTANGTAGEHRSSPMTWTTPYGRLVAVRTQPAAAGSSRLAIRAVVALPNDIDHAQISARTTLLDVDAAIRSALGLPTARTEP